MLKHLVCISVLVLALMVAAAPAAKPSPYIAIDPVGNHALDEVFFINGTSDLTNTSQPLLLSIEPANVNPGGAGSAFQASVTQYPGPNGLNTWSCNATSTLWSTYGVGPRQIATPGAYPGEYRVTVNSNDPDQFAVATQTFSLVPALSATATTVTPAPTATAPSIPATAQAMPTTKPSPLPEILVAIGIISGLVLRKRMA